LRVGGHKVASVPCPRGAPERAPVPSELADKVSDLAGDRLDGLLDDPSAPAARVAAVLGPGA
jgi:hypothetical protein